MGGPITLVICHLVIAWAILGKTSQQPSFSRCLYSLVCSPPLFVDWLDCGWRHEGIEVAWKKTRKSLLLFAALNIMESLAMTVPLALLHHCIADRTAAMTHDDQFALLPEEVRSANVVMGLLVCSVLASVLVPIAQVLLALLYFKIGHPWSKILIAKTSVFPKIHPFRLNDFGLL